MLIMMGQFIFDFAPRFFAFVHESLNTTAPQIKLILHWHSLAIDLIATKASFFVALFYPLFFLPTTSIAATARFCWTQFI